MNNFVIVSFEDSIANCELPHKNLIAAHNFLRKKNIPKCCLKNIFLNMLNSHTHLMSFTN